MAFFFVNQMQNVTCIKMHRQMCSPISITVVCDPASQLCCMAGGNHWLTYTADFAAAAAAELAAAADLAAAANLVNFFCYNRSGTHRHGF